VPSLPPAWLSGTLAAAGSCALVGVGVVVRGPAGLFNDFYDYWAAARVLNAGGNPYNVGRIQAEMDSAGLHATVGQGYSYPLPLAEVMRPLALVPPFPAALAFSILGALAFGLGIGLMARYLRLGPGRSLLVGGLSAAFLPTTGSLYFGQVNLLVFLGLSLAVVGSAEVAGIAAAAAVKVYPAAAVLAQLAQRRWRTGAMTAALFLALLLLPAVVGPASGFFSLRGQLLEPDTYWTNQSINGMVSRLGLASTWTSPPFPGLPVAPIAMGLALLLLACVTWRVAVAGARDQAGGLALLLSAAAVAAPKASAWNLAPALLAVCLVVGRRPRPAAIVLATGGYLLIEAQGPFNAARESVYRGSSWFSLCSSLATFGCLMVVLALSLQLGSLPGDDVDGTELDDAAIRNVQHGPAVLGLHRDPG
jgi:hypothetical protein